MRQVFPGDLQRRQAVEGGMGVVCENQVKVALFERRNEISLSFNPGYMAADTVDSERFLNKLCVPGVIFKMQNAQLRLHFRASEAAPHSSA